MSTDRQIADFVAQYPVLQDPIGSIQDVCGAYGIPARIHVAVKRMDEFLLHFIGNPTSGRAWIPGTGPHEGLEGTEEARLYAHSLEWNMEEPLFHEWTPESKEKNEKVGNVVFLIEKEDLTVRPKVLSYIIVEVCNRWFVPRRNPRYMMGRTALKLVAARFVIFLPPKDMSLQDLCRQALSERSQARNFTGELLANRVIGL